jgi:hypothetical protein
MPDIRQIVAYHEAGHAIARAVHRVPLSKAFIAADGVTGETTFPPFRTSDRFSAAIRSLAGPVAEARYSGRALEEILSGPGRTDHAHAQAWLSVTQRNITEAVEVAECLVDLHWGAIDRVAAVLSADGEISGVDVAAIVRPNG